MTTTPTSVNCDDMRPSSFNESPETVANDDTLMHCGVEESDAIKSKVDDSTNDKDRTPSTEINKDLAKSIGDEHSNAIYNKNEHEKDAPVTNSDNSSNAPAEAPAASATGSSGFFGRMQSFGSTAAPILGEVYGRAQKRAVQLREQAAAEVERLRQQQLQQHQQQQSEVVIPPSTGTLVADPHSNDSNENGTNAKSIKSSGEEGSVKSTEAMEQKLDEGPVTPGTTNATNNNFTGAKESKVNQASISSPLRNAFNLVRVTSSELAKDLMLPPAISFSYDEEDCHTASDSSAGYEEEGEVTDSRISSESKSSVEKNYSMSKQTEENSDEKESDHNSNIGAMRTKAFAATNAVVNAYAEFRTVGRYRMMKDNEPPQNIPTSHDPVNSPKRQQLMGKDGKIRKNVKPFETSYPIVGGADRVGGLRHLKLGDIISPRSYGSSVDDVKSIMHSSGENEKKDSANDIYDHNDDDVNTTTVAESSVSNDAATTASGIPSSNPAIATSSSTATATSATLKRESSKPSTSYYEDAVRSVLKPGQRALFFGKGTMGVILKPTYLGSWRGKDGGGLLSPTVVASSSKKGGVYIDFLIPGGHAENSGVVYVGDHVLKVGNVDVSTMTLEEVVEVISEAKRPNIMVLTSEHDVVAVSKPEKGEQLNGASDSRRNYFISALDLTFGFLNKVAAEGIDLETKKQPQDQPSSEKECGLKEVMSRNSLLDEDDDDEGEVEEREQKENNNESEEEVLFDSDVGENVLSNCPLDANREDFSRKTSAATSVSSMPISEALISAEDDADEDTLPTIQSNSDPSFSHSFYKDLEKLRLYASHRTNGHNHEPETSLSHLPTLLERAALLNSEFRVALRMALYECCADPRRCQFLEKYLKNFQSKREIEARAGLNGGKLRNNVTDDDSDVTLSKNQRKLLYLYLELCKFRNMVIVYSDREKLLEHARKISSLFLPDDIFDQDAKCLPEYVAHVALGGVENVQSVRRALQDEDDFFENDSGDGFHAIRSSLEEFLSMQESFLSFLGSDDCARMRAYLRGCAPFICDGPEIFLTPNQKSQSSHSMLVHAILHLLCAKENEEKMADDTTYKNDAMMATEGKRKMGLISILSCADFIKGSLKNAAQAAIEGLIEDGMTRTSDNFSTYIEVISCFQFLWEAFIAPGGGCLSSLTLLDDTQEALDSVRRLLVASVDEVLAPESNHFPSVAMARVLTSNNISASLTRLCECLLGEYTLNVYPEFRRHVFFEWLCLESKSKRLCAATQSNDINNLFVCKGFHGLSSGWINRFLRKIELPNGLSLHRMSCGSGSPSSAESRKEATLEFSHNADVAVVFGSDFNDEDIARDDASTSNFIRRFSCVSLQPYTNVAQATLTPEQIPAVFERYAAIPPFHERSFQSMLRDEKNRRLSFDGWEVSLTNFIIPSGTGMSGLDDNDWLYCVSLVFRKSSDSSSEAASVPLMPLRTRKYRSEREICNECVSELVCNDDDIDSDASPPIDGSEAFYSPLEKVSERGVGRTMKVSSKLEKFNSKLKDQKWSNSVGGKTDVTIGLALISKRNVTPAMRETLSLLYSDFCELKSCTEDEQCQTSLQHFCQPLIDVLGVLSHPQVEEKSLQCILQPYLRFATSKWVERPLSSQKELMIEDCGAHLIQSIPPVPLALMFVTILLEQKVVFSSSRRGMLMSATHAAMEMLKPLTWPHLLVPLVPSSMINDLIHYPAPFVIGVPTDDKKNADIISSLPPDVTLVDLDVGRVVLASIFSNDDYSAMSDEEAGGPFSGALREQMLRLAESLGGLFGTAISPDSWCLDSPSIVYFNNKHNERNNSRSRTQASGFSAIQSTSREFVEELLSGVLSCCIWIEEKRESEEDVNDESAIIFDEDRFLHIKKLRSEGLFSPLFTSSAPSIGSTGRNRLSTTPRFSISLDYFDLILKTFLRAQCLSTFICKGDKKSMLFW